MKRRRRDWYEIIYSMLDVIPEDKPVRKTYIMRKVKLSSPQATEYLSFLKGKNFVHEKPDGIYRTKLGTEVHYKLKELKELGLIKKDY